ncbi:MAG: prepilin-type N-terminal cleavage/methylation domain-containing protein [Vicinamibacterales bacterium]|nr:prepilin-type N-terminal cleavage/methylation domain-containing protein [Vicinamibacterales bacterium]
MERVTRGQKGFTLLEIIVVLAVIGALAAMLAPVVFRYIDDAKRAQAQNDTNTIASAVQQMYKDTGRWPFYDVGTGALKHAVATDAAVLSSNTACVGTLADDTTAPDVGSSGMGAGTVICDSLVNQLIKNAGFTTAYATTGARPWRGPYLERIPALDPWARSYLVNIVNGDPTTEGFATQKWVIAISAGPDGILQTSATALGSSNPQVAGDDVIARVK